MASNYTSTINITSSGRQARGYVEASLSSQTDTTATIYWYIKCQQKSAALYGQVANCYVDGSFAGSCSGYITSSSSSWKDVCSKSGYVTVNKSNSTSSRNVSVSIDTRVQPVDGYGSVTSSWASASCSVTISGKTYYTISYNANGGSGAPSSQTKWHGTALTLSSTTPSRSGYEFLGWSTSSTATSATYSAGGSYSTNANTTLYAVWKATVPGAPSGIIITKSGTSATITWTNNPSAIGLTGTKIYEDKNGTVGTANKNSTTSSTQTSATISGLLDNCRYRYKLVAYNSMGDSEAGYSGYVYTAPAAPASGYGMNNNGKVVLNASVSNIAYGSSYEWQRSQDQSTWTSISLTQASGSDSHSLSGNVYYRVRAVAPDGTKGSWFTFLCGNRVNLYFWIPG